MRLAVFGAGGIGAYYGSGFASGGADVHLIARGAHLEALRRDGLTIETPGGTVRQQLHASADPAEIGPVDVVLFCVKSFDTETAAPALRPLLAPDTAVVSLQNGVDNEAKIAAAIGWQHVLGGSAYIFAAIRSPGVVVASGPRSIVFGEWLGGDPSPRVQAILQAAAAGGVGATTSLDIQVAKWEKYVLLAALSAVSAATQLPLGAIRRSPAAVALLRDLMTEVWAVGRASGVGLDDGLVDRQFALVMAQDEESKASLQTDLVAGHRMELDALQGATLDLGRELDIPTPNMAAAYAILEPWAIRNAARSPSTG
ncbi:MAG: 2-dehydropantoate 2-reductase [Chloroflexota bacterium]|jgi:2-dehydropantoate 2-reductase|nr:2-dehydropantoate 2-reductase [Chloroflexota bacterium]